MIGLLALGAASSATASPTQAATSVLRITNSVVLTRADGSIAPVAQQFRVWCGRWARDVPTPSVHVLIGDARHGAVWSLSAVVADIKRRPVVRFPFEPVWNKPSRALIGGGDGRNEFTTQEEESSGRVTFSRVRCERRRTEIGFRVDGVMGSEFIDGTPVTIRGSFRARG